MWSKIKQYLLKVYLPEYQSKHWYAFSFSGFNSEGQQCEASTYIGYKTHGVTKARILDAKRSAGVNDDAVLIAVSFLGFMAKEEFTGNTNG